MYILYGGPFTRALITEMVLLEAGLAYELCKVDIVEHEHLQPEHLAVNPAGWVPALITPGGQTLYETPALSLYLADHHAVTHLAPRIEEPDRGPFLSGLFYLVDEIEPAIKRHNYPHRYVVREDDTSAMKTLALEQALERVGGVERRLADGGPIISASGSVWWTSPSPSGPHNSTGWMTVRRFAGAWISCGPGRFSGRSSTR